MSDSVATMIDSRDRMIRNAEYLEMWHSPFPGTRSQRERMAAQLRESASRLAERIRNAGETQ